MNATLTERYISAVVKSLQESQDDVRAELEASIAEDVEGRVGQGEDREDAERAVLTELGDPAVLAAGYADRPMHLIGPRYYVMWWRLLKLLLIIVPTVVAGGSVFGQLIAGTGPGTIIGQTVLAVMMSALHVAFWVTLSFVILERSGADLGMRWTLDDLPDPRPTSTGRGEPIVELVFLLVFAAVILWDALRGLVPIGGETLSILNPDLWPWWIAVLYGLIALQAAFALTVYLRRRWTLALAVLNAVLAGLFMAWVLVLLVHGELINPEIVTVLQENRVDDDALHVLAVLIGFGSAALAVWEVIDGGLKYRRDKRSTEIVRRTS